LKIVNIEQGPEEEFRTKWKTPLEYGVFEKGLKSTGTHPFTRNKTPTRATQNREFKQRLRAVKLKMNPCFADRTWQESAKVEKTMSKYSRISILV